MWNIRMEILVESKLSFMEKKTNKQTKKEEAPKQRAWSNLRGSF